MSDKWVSENTRLVKHRLIGGAALTLVAVLLLPAIMDPKPRGPWQDVEVKFKKQENKSFTLAGKSDLPAAATTRSSGFRWPWSKKPAEKTEIAKAEIGQTSKTESAGERSKATNAKRDPDFITPPLIRVDPLAPRVGNVATGVADATTAKTAAAVTAHPPRQTKPTADSSSHRKPDRATATAAKTSEPVTTSDKAAQAKAAQVKAANAAKPSARPTPSQERKTPSKTERTGKDTPPKADPKTKTTKPEKKTEHTPSHERKASAKEPAPNKKSVSTGQLVKRNGGYFVFSSPLTKSSSAGEWQSKLSDKGILTAVESVSTKEGARTRLRAGPYVSEDVAQKALARMRALGL